MSKKIVVLTGSPREQGNTDLLADAFIRGAEKAGHMVTKIWADDFCVDSCLACDLCRDGECCLEDDFEELAPEFLSADAIVVATPLYWYAFPAGLKAVIDRWYALCASGHAFENKECGLIACCADEEEGAFDGLVGSWNRIAQFMHWENKGQLLVPGVMDPGDVKKTDALQKAEELGRNF